MAPLLMHHHIHREFMSVNDKCQTLELTCIIENMHDKYFKLMGQFSHAKDEIESYIYMKCQRL